MKEVLSVKNMRESDFLTIKNGTSSKTLMYLAAKGVYDNYNFHDEIAIFTGSGNNAGDGYALSLILKENGYKPTIILCSDKFSEDGIYYFNLCKENNIKIIEFNDIKDKYDIAVDCLLGTGFKGELSDHLNNVINYINNNFKEVISVDINSGLNGDTGMCNNAIKSSKTISIGYLKPGLFLNKAKDYIKEVVNVDIGINISQKPYYLIEESDLKEIVSPRLNDSNKGDFGSVGIMGGSIDYPGAIRLACLAQTSLYSGCGLSRLIVPNCIYDLIFKNVLETTIKSISSIDGKMIFKKEEIDDSLNNLKALAIGVGWSNSDEYKKILEYILLNYNIPIVIDADGINTLSKMDLSILNKTNGNVILTPHLKEFSRLTGYSILDIKNNLVEYGKEFVNKYNVTLLLKGPSTLVFNKDNVYIINSGCSGMASAGSGDVLTGILTGLLGYSKDSIELTTCYAAYLNGKAGEEAQKEFCDISLVSSETLKMITKVIKNIRNNIL